MVYLSCLIYRFSLSGVGMPGSFSIEPPTSANHTSEWIKCVLWESLSNRDRWFESLPIILEDLVPYHLRDLPRLSPYGLHVA